MGYINRVRRVEPEYASIYINGLIRNFDFYVNGQLDREKLKRSAYYGIKYFGADAGSTVGSIMTRFQCMEIVRGVIAKLTPAELLQVFPLDKRYDGKKCGCKDYFYAINKLREHGMDKEIGVRVDKFLWDYTNYDVQDYIVNFMSTSSDIYREQTGKGALEEFMEKQGATLSTLITDSRGRQFLKDSKTGTLTRLRKRFPRYLRLVNTKMG